MSAVKCSSSSETFADVLSARLQQRHLLDKVASAFKQRGLRLVDLEGISEQDLRDLCDEFHLDVVDRVLVTKSIHDAAAATARTLRVEQDDELDAVLIDFDQIPAANPPAPKPAATTPDRKKAKGKAKGKAKRKKAAATPTATPSPKRTAAAEPAGRAPRPSPRRASPKTDRPVAGAERSVSSREGGSPARARPTRTRRREPRTVAEAICAVFDRNHKVSLATFADFLQNRLTPATFDLMWKREDVKRRGFVQRNRLLPLLTFAYKLCHTFHYGRTAPGQPERSPAEMRMLDMNELERALKPVCEWIVVNELVGKPTMRMHDLQQAGAWVARLAGRS